MTARSWQSQTVQPNADAALHSKRQYRAAHSFWILTPTEWKYKLLPHRTQSAASSEKILTLTRERVIGSLLTQKNQARPGHYVLSWCGWRRLWLFCTPLSSAYVTKTCADQRRMETWRSHLVDKAESLALEQLEDSSGTVLISRKMKALHQIYQTA